MRWGDRSEVDDGFGKAGNSKRDQKKAFRVEFVPGWIKFGNKEE
jgi:hypothetical protein